MSEMWKQKADQRYAAEEARIIAENATWETAEVAKTPEQKAEEKVNRAMCDATEEHARSPAFYAAEKKMRRALHKQFAEERRIREGGHPKVDLSTGFPALGTAAAGAGGKK